MITPSPRNDKGHARRLLVTLVITTAAAAVTAGVVLKTHQPAEAVVQRTAAASPMLAGAIAPATPAAPRRVEWRDPWKRPTPLSESASTLINAVPDDGAMRSDPSVPSAAAALEGAAGSSDEPATF